MGRRVEHEGDISQRVYVKISPVITAKDGTRSIKITRWPGTEDETAYTATHNEESDTWDACAEFNAEHPKSSPLTRPSLIKIKSAMRQRIIGSGIRRLRAGAAERGQGGSPSKK